MIPWKLIITIIIALFMVFFVGYNWEYKSDISLLFVTLTDIPIVISLFGAFSAGLIVALPYAFHSGLKKKLTDRINKKNRKADKNEAEITPSDNAVSGKPRGKKKNVKKNIKNEKNEKIYDPGLIGPPNGNDETEVVKK